MLVTQSEVKKFLETLARHTETGALKWEVLAPGAYKTRIEHLRILLTEMPAENVAPATHVKVLTFQERLKLPSTLRVEVTTPTLLLIDTDEDIVVRFDAAALDAENALLLASLYRQVSLQRDEEKRAVLERACKALEALAQ